MVKKQNCVILDTNSFIVYIKADDICKDVGEDVETRFGFDTSDYELNISLPKGKKCNWINER